jgi:hypothetical protein
MGKIITGMKRSDMPATVENRITFFNAVDLTNFRNEKKFNINRKE